METKEVLQKLRRGRGWSQDELAEKVFVTRQAVSRWETGETVPNIESLRLLSALLGDSINTLLGSPQKLYCQCCGMPLNEDSLISREDDGSYNEDYCKWCYTNGEFVYKTKEHLLDFLINSIPNPENINADERRNQFDLYLSQLKHWK